MKLALHVIERAGDRGDDRRAVVREFSRIRGRHTALGTYDIDQRGDTTLSDDGGYRIKRGKLVFDRIMRAAG